jgi:hypothetical protein
VETQPGADIDVEIGMMHSVQAPKRWHGMKEHMLKVDREIQEDNGGHYGNPGRDWHYVEEAKSVRGSNEGQTGGRGWKEDADQQRVDRDNGEIIGPSPAASYALASSGLNEFPNCHQGEHTAKCGQPDILLTCEQSVAHGLFAPGLP